MKKEIRKLKIYEVEIDKLMTKNKGGVTPEQIVESAKKKSSPLHSYFEWDNNEAAKLWRLHKARILFGCVVKEITITSQSKPITANKYICVKMANNKHKYIPTTKAISTKRYARQIIAECIVTTELLADKLKLFQSEL